MEEEEEEEGNLSIMSLVEDGEEIGELVLVVSNEMFDRVFRDRDFGCRILDTF